ncbi:MAG TPA: zinc-binding dehydrogenase [Vicinamibacteria bacterium]|nr:zinc-binding dehydrogenase [Vicinamibacteria bacterium]
MKAMRIHRHGGPEVLQLNEIDPPHAGAGEVTVEVKACALNHLDIWTRTGMPNVRIEMPRILGSDVSGIVVETGEGVTDVPLGEEVVLQPGLSCRRCLRCLQGRDNECQQYKVLGSRVDGGYTERLSVPVENLLPKPKRLSFEEAASVPLVFLTAWHMLVERARLRPGEDVLVLAAGSGVGIAAIQIAKLWGARVIATASTDAKLARAQELGADDLVNYREQDFAREVRRLTDKKGVDVVIEHVGQDTFPKSLRSLARGGRLVTCGATSGPDIEVDLRYVFARHLALLGSYMGGKHELAELLPFFDTGRLKPVVDRVFPLEEAADAHRRMENREQFGKIVLRI